MKRHLYNIFFTVVAGMAVLCGSCTHEDTDISPVSSGIAVNIAQTHPLYPTFGWIWKYPLVRVMWMLTFM